jgi:hypothetical protein
VDAIVMTEDSRRFLRKRGRPPCVLGLTLKVRGSSAGRRAADAGKDSNPDSNKDSNKDSDGEGDVSNDQAGALACGRGAVRLQDDSADPAASPTAAEAFGAVRAVESISDEILVSDLLDEIAAPRKPQEEKTTASILPDAIEAGLYLCSPAVFDRLTELALQLPYFTLGQGMQLVAADGKLGALDTQGYKWFAVETADQLRHHAQQLSAADYTSPPMAASAAPKAPALSPPLPLRHTVPSLTPADTLAPARAARRRYHILSLGDGGDFSDKPCFLSGGAGMLTTAHDYLRFAQCLLNDGELDVSCDECKHRSAPAAARAPHPFKPIPCSTLPIQARSLLNIRSHTQSATADAQRPSPFRDNFTTLRASLTIPPHFLFRASGSSRVKRSSSCGATSCPSRALAPPAGGPNALAAAQQRRRSRPVARRAMLCFLPLVRPKEFGSRWSCSLTNHAFPKPPPTARLAFPAPAVRAEAPPCCASPQS